MGEKGISGQMLALELDVSESTVSRWRNGQAMSACQVVQICEYIDISADELLFGGRRLYLKDDIEVDVVRIIRDMNPDERLIALAFLRMTRSNG